MNKNIKNMIERWGQDNRQSPSDNAILKNKILSKIPTTSESLRVGHSAKRLMPWPSLAFAVLALFVLIGSSVNTTHKLGTSYNNIAYQVERGESSSSAPSVGNQMDISTKGEGSYDGYGIPITDNREFQKIYYNATIKTREVNDTMGKIEIIVRGLGGRIDSSSGGEKYGYVNYAIPADKFAIFKSEIKELTGRKLFTDNVNSENMLPQKQTIEKEQERVQNLLTSLNKERTQIISTHKTVVRSYESRIVKLSTESEGLQNEWQSASSQRRDQITSRLAQISAEKNLLSRQIESENRNYQNKLANVDARISMAQSNSKYVEEQNQNLLNNVATINGSISLSWVSLWGIADIYTPGPLLAWLLLFAAFLSYGRYILFQRIDLY